MSGQGQPLGIFHLAWTENESAQDGSRDRKRLAEMVADTIALAVSNVRLREALKDQTIRDPLTRLYNRRYLDDSLNREVSRARRAKTTIGIIMIDLDNFKHSNDTFGHPTGDHLLRSFGAYLKALVRPEDIPSPFGGEEFALILPGASRHIVLERAEKLRKGFQNMPMEHGLGVGNAVDTLSLSCGVAIFPDDKPSNRTGNRCSMPNVR
jgi:diguanylate cyclase (GGDEF)-like protein